MLSGRTPRNHKLLFPCVQWNRQSPVNRVIQAASVPACIPVRERMWWRGVVEALQQQGPVTLGFEAPAFIPVTRAD